MRYNSYAVGYFEMWCIGVEPEKSTLQFARDLTFSLLFVFGIPALVAKLVDFNCDSLIW